MSAAPDRPRILSWRLLGLTILTLVVLAVLWTQIADRDALLEVAASGDPLGIGLAAALMGVALVVSAFRNHFVLRALGFVVPVSAIFKAIMATWPLSVVAPSRLHEFLRAVVLRDHVPVVEGAGAVLAERVVDVQVLCVLALFGSLLARQWVWAATATGLFAAAFGGAVLLAVAPDRVARLPIIRRKEEKVQRLIKAFAALRSSPSAFAGVVACSACVWTMAVTITFVLLNAFGGGVEFVTTLALWPLAIFAGLLPVTISGMGTRDAAFLSLLTASSVPVSEEAVLSATMAYAGVTIFLPALCGLPLMLKQMKSLSQAPS